tara:strand:+ start:457 stop:603 length:147 start_codon:yes stop_codon:yes gene_type:complete
MPYLKELNENLLLSSINIMTERILKNKKPRRKKTIEKKNPEKNKYFKL